MASDGELFTMELEGIDLILKTFNQLRNSSIKNNDIWRRKVKLNYNNGEKFL